MEIALRTPRTRRLATLVVAAGSLALCAAAEAEASTTPAPGLRVVWERDLSIEAAAPAPARVGAAMGAEAGLWPRVDRVEVHPGARERAFELDVRGRYLPETRRPGAVLR